MEFYEINGEFLEVLKAIRTKRNVASVVILSVSIFLITLDFETFVRSTHRSQKCRRKWAFMAQQGFFQKVSSLYSTYFLGIQGKQIDI